MLHWATLVHPGIPVVEKIARTLAVYTFLLLGLRFAGKRELGQLNAFDLVMLLLLTSALQNAIIGNDTSLTGGLIGGTTLLVFNYLVVRVLYRHRKLDRLLEGDADTLIVNGKLLERRLEKELITRDELEAAARRQGIPSLAHVKTARLEVGGALTFVQREPTDEELRHEELLDRLARLEKKLAAAIDGEAARSA